MNSQHISHSFDNPAASIWQRVRALPAIAPHWIIMGVLFIGALGLGYELLPGQIQRVAMLERDGQSLQARTMLEKSYQSGDRSFRTLYQALEEFEKDLHQHIHLENNILFPRAEEIEDRMRS